MDAQKHTQPAADVPAGENAFGRTSKLSLVIAPDKIRELFFTAPYKILRPFHQQGFLQIMVVKVSAGTMAGDRQDVRISLEDGTKAEFLSQSYEKIHRMDEGEAVRSGHIEVGRNATLFYAPLPVLPFADSAFRNTFHIELRDASSRLFYSDILACGRAARGEHFLYRLYRSRVKIDQADELIYFDNLRFTPKDSPFDYAGLTQYEGYTHLGTYLLMNFSLQEEDLRRFIETLPCAASCQIGLTAFAPQCFCLKALANGSEPLVELQTQIKNRLRQETEKV